MEITKTVIRYYRREVYGNDLLYPLDHAYIIEKLTGKKTLNALTMSSLESLGISFQEVLRPKDVK